MKLTTEQIQIIETALNEKCNFKDFDDVRIELVDHIATEIEQELETNAYSFEQAFVKVMTRWNPLILPKSWSWYDNVPYIVCQLWKKMDLKYNYSAIPITLLISIFLLYFRKEVSLAYITYSVSLIGLVVSFYLINLHRKNQYNTVLSVYASNQIYTLTGVLILNIITNIGLNIYDRDMESVPMLWVIIHITVILILRTILMRKNIKIENQLLKVSS